MGYISWLYIKSHGSVNHCNPPRRIGVQPTVFPHNLFSEIISKKTKSRLGKQECKSKMDGKSSSFGNSWFFILVCRTDPGQICLDSLTILHSKHTVVKCVTVPGPLTLLQRLTVRSSTMSNKKEKSLTLYMWISSGSEAMDRNSFSSAFFTPRSQEEIIIERSQLFQLGQ